MILVQRPRIFDVDVLGGVALLVFGIVAWFGIIAPVSAQQAASSDLASASAVADAAIQRAADTQRRTDADIRRLRDAVAEQARRAPTPASLPQFLQRIATLAEDCGLKVAQVVPQPARPSDGRMLSDVQITAQGTMLDLARLLDRLRRENPYFALVEYSISRGKDETRNHCTLVWTLRLSMLPDDADRQAGAP